MQPASTASAGSPPRTTAPPSVAPAVTRAIAILRLLGKSETALGVSAIAGKLGMVPSSCLHILRVLVAGELVKVDPATKLYRLDGGILTLARSVLRPSSFARLVQPALDCMSEAWRTTAVAVQVLSLEHIVVVAIADSRLPVRIHVELGSRFPALMSATGRCLAAFSDYPGREIEERFRKVCWHNPPTLNAWRADVRAARRNYFSVDEGRYLSGVTVVAAPVLDGSLCMTHAVVELGVSEQIARTGVGTIAEELRAIARSFSANAYDRALRPQFSAPVSTHAGKRKHPS